jgi:hypothetical protein
LKVRDEQLPRRLKMPRLPRLNRGQERKPNEEFDAVWEKAQKGELTAEEFEKEIKRIFK